MEDEMERGVRKADYGGCIRFRIEGFLVHGFRLSGLAV